MEEGDLQEAKNISYLPTAKKWDRKSYTALGNGHMIQNFLLGSHEHQSGRYRPGFGACPVHIWEFDSTIGYFKIVYFFDAASLIKLIFCMWASVSRPRLFPVTWPAHLLDFAMGFTRLGLT
jgi:hypothetical protein